MNMLQVRLIRAEYDHCHQMVEDLNRANGLPVIRYEYVRGGADREGFRVGYLKRDVIETKGKS